MDKRRLSQWMLLAVICLSFSIGESYAQKNDFGNLARYSKQNAALPKAYFRFAHRPFPGLGGCQYDYRQDG